MPTKRSLADQKLSASPQTKKERSDLKSDLPKTDYESDVSMGEFEDAWEDEQESEEEVIVNEEDEEGNDMNMEEEKEEELKVPFVTLCSRKVY
jgi:hypothetical protein